MVLVVCTGDKRNKEQQLSGWVKKLFDDDLEEKQQSRSDNTVGCSMIKLRYINHIWPRKVTELKEN